REHQNERRDREPKPQRTMPGIQACSPAQTARHAQRAAPLVPTWQSQLDTDDEIAEQHQSARSDDQSPSVSGEQGLMQFSRGPQQTGAAVVVVQGSALEYLAGAVDAHGIRLPG